MEEVWVTLILSSISPKFALQVSDRLVVSKYLGKIKDHNRLANKTIVLRTFDAIVCIGFAGLAYLDGIPTDQWLVERILGDEGCLKDNFGIRFGFNSNVKNIGFIIEKIKDEIFTTKVKHIDSAGLEISIVGWQITNKRWRTFKVEMIRINGKTSIKRSKRYPSKDENFTISSVGQIVEKSLITDRLWPYKYGDLVGLFSLRELESIFVDVIRDVRNKDLIESCNTTIGGDLMSVFISPQQCGCRFFPSTSHKAVLSAPNYKTQLEVSYSPWIISPDIVCSPSAQIGNSVISLRGIDFHIYGAAASAGGILSLMSSVDPIPPP